MHCAILLQVLDYINSFWANFRLMTYPLHFIICVRMHFVIMCGCTVRPGKQGLVRTWVFMALKMLDRLVTNVQSQPSEFPTKKGPWWVARLKCSISLEHFKILIYFNLWALRVESRKSRFRIASPDRNLSICSKQLSPRPWSRTILNRALQGGFRNSWLAAFSLRGNLLLPGKSY